MSAVSAHSIGYGYNRFPLSTYSEPTKLIRPKAEIIKIPSKLPKPKVVRRESLQITFSNFSFDIDASITNLKRASGTAVYIEALIAKDVSIMVTINGKIEGEYFVTEDVTLRLNPNKNVAHAEFIASTATAILALGGKLQLQIPIIGLKLELLFPLSLKEISSMLRRRQLAYRIMVIEAATGKRFQLPRNEYTGKEVEDITFIYNAIINRSFVWSTDKFFLHLSREKFDDMNDFINEIKSKEYHTGHFEAGPMEHITFLFGNSISLGSEIIRMTDMILENPESVINKLEDKDISELVVPFIIPTGEALYSYEYAPSLPSQPWDELTQKLINLEEMLDELILNRYHAAARATLGDLPEKEQAALLASLNGDDEE